MILQQLISAQTNGSALSNSSSATSILPAQAKFTLPANYFTLVGHTLYIRAAGRISNIVTTPGTLTLDVRMGGTVVFNGGAMQLSTTAHTNVPWIFEANMTLRASGSSSNFFGQGIFFSQAANISGADPTTTHSMLMAPNSAPAVGNNVDATTALVLDLFATFSVADPANALTLHQYRAESWLY